MSPDTPVYVPGYGEMTAQDVVDLVAEADPKVSPWEADLRKLEQIATENYRRDAWDGAGPSDERASTA